MSHHVPSGFCLRHALGCQLREVAAALDAALSVPGALAVPHQHDTLAGADTRQAQGWGVLQQKQRQSAGQQLLLRSCIRT